MARGMQWSRDWPELTVGQKMTGEGGIRFRDNDCFERTILSLISNTKSGDRKGQWPSQAIPHQGPLMTVIEKRNHLK